MEELIKTFHIETNLLIAQIVNFTIVLLVLYKFAYKPILKTLNERTSKIEKGVKDAEEAKKKLEEVSIEEKEILKKAKIESQEIIKKAEETAKKEAENISVEAKKQTEKMIVDAQKSIEQEKGKMMAEVKSEIAGLVVAATEKLIGEKMSSDKDKELVEKSIK
ncbi:MAG TPA: F0F1 ATP synthase subunit B, partial [Candidatus Moranbacteria bacterium]|nr:F0F1 ATP synthase subunit B [Candidatus Moranbacteria bacterium]